MGLFIALQAPFRLCGLPISTRLIRLRWYSLVGLTLDKNAIFRVSDNNEPLCKSQWVSGVLAVVWIQ